MRFVIKMNEGLHYCDKTWQTIVKYMNPSHIVEARDLRRSYKIARGKCFEAVAGVSLGVRRGELFALLGTNGSGKTSIMEMLEGQAPPTGGTCAVLGINPYKDRGAVRRRTGIVLQDGGLQGDLTVNETARMWSGTLTHPRPFEETLDLVDLRDRANVPVNRLSGGERRRLDFALAILGRPEVLFLDEPTAGLDPESRARTHGLIRDLLDSGTTVVLTTHYLQEAEDLADRLAILHEGVVAAVGTPSEIAASTPARISFGVVTAERPDLRSYLSEGASAQVRKEADSHWHVVVTTQQMQSSLDAVLHWARTDRLQLERLDARPGSLEQTFLAMAGTRSKAQATEESA